jgi:hypothetical protein
MTCKVHVNNLHSIRVEHWEEIQRMGIEIFVGPIPREEKTLLKSTMRLKAVVKAY